MPRKRLLSILFVAVLGLVAMPTDGHAKWKAKFGFKHYFEQTKVNIFRMEFGNDYKIAGPFHINIENAHEINDGLYISQIGIGFNLRFKVAKPLEITFRSNFIFDIGVKWKGELDTFYGLGALFGPGLAILLTKSFGFNLEVTFEVGKHMGVQTFILSTNNKRLFWGINAMAGIEF